ncbi:hypothetical protein [Allomuricauda sp. SCSIO 65647]|uniref:hypothetical protein n=1 Tax=Allomuricauda sp. SCSIO 65647 TaxID=2908843 RepID=UPI001F17894F|nr:hypothetical protein [Muricauda sp. SCSIO 65647]UJH69115.1 hypothetical protein L0P89_07850 [Muricauda sp. SCSIO 65647]
MRTFFKLIVYLMVIGCSSQVKIEDFSEKDEMSYILSSLQDPIEISKPIYDGALFLSIFEINDSRASIKNSNESEEIYSSIFISITPDGDYYTVSKLYKIERLMRPKIIRIEEDVFPTLEISFEHGNYDSRKTEKFRFSGEFD